MAQPVDITFTRPGFKMVILIPLDLKMSVGKVASQASHAAMVAGLKAQTFEGFTPWLLGGMKKVVLQCADSETLFDVKSHADSLGLVTHLVCDEGLTEVEFGSATALAIGPANEVLLNKVTGVFDLLGTKPRRKR